MIQTSSLFGGLFNDMAAITRSQSSLKLYTALATSMTPSFPPWCDDVWTVGLLSNGTPTQQVPWLSGHITALWPTNVNGYLTQDPKSRPDGTRGTSARRGLLLTKEDPTMARRQGHTDEQILAALWQAESGATVAEV